MTTCTLKSYISLPMQPNLNRPTYEPTTHLLLPLKTKPRRNPLDSKQQSPIIKRFTEESSRDKKKPLTSLIFKPNVPRSSQRTDGLQRFVILGAAAFGLAVLLAGIDDGTKALALGLEGSLVEGFWDNMRRYGLYIVTVSTGVIYTVFEPILDLLKNPITVILVITIFLGGSVYIVTQVLSAMVVVSYISYDYGY